MTDSTNDAEHPSISDTYCKTHAGLWPHECGCDKESNLDLEVLKKINQITTKALKEIASWQNIDDVNGYCADLASDALYRCSYLLAQEDLE